MVYVLNSLLRTQPTGGLWTAISSDVQMQVLDRNDPENENHLLDPEDAPMVPIGTRQGLFFFAHIMMDKGCMRLSNIHLIPTGDIVHMYEESNMYNLIAHFGGSIITVEAVKSHPNRIPNKQMKTSSVEQVRGGKIPTLAFGLQAQGIVPQVGQGIAGDDVDMVDLSSEEEDEGNIDKHLSTIWYQFLFDMIQKSPNSRLATGASYGTLGVLARANINEKLFKEYQLPFNVVRWKKVDPSYWRTIFDRLFTRRGTVVKKSFQGLRQCRYWKLYVSLIDGLTPGEAMKVRKALRKRFDKLSWMTMTGSDRVWTTRPDMSGAHSTIPKNLQTPAPQIAINPMMYVNQQVTLYEPIAEVEEVAEGGGGEGSDGSESDEEEGRRTREGTSQSMEVNMVRRIGRGPRASGSPMGGIRGVAARVRGGKERQIVVVESSSDEKSGSLSDWEY